MNSKELIEQCDNLTHRKLDYWVNGGVFPAQRNPGRAGQRIFNDEDLRVAQVLARISGAFDAWSNGRGGLVNLYREAATQVRAGADLVRIVLADGIELTATVTGARTLPVPQAPGLPPEDFPGPGQPTMNLLEAEPNFVPGIGADNG